MASKRRWIFLSAASCVLLTTVSACAQIDLSAQLSNSFCTDDFNRADSDTIGENWETIATTATASPPQTGISNGKLRMYLPPNLFTGFTCKTKIVVPKSRLSVQVTPTSNATNHKIFFIAREQDLLNAYTCGFDLSKTILRRTVGGVNGPILQSTSVTTLTANTVTELSFETNGADLTCTLSQNGTTVRLTMTDGTFSSGYVGMFGENQAGPIEYLIDNFKTEIFQ